MSTIPWLASELRAGGCTVKTYDGWKTRGRPPSSGPFDPFGLLIHHTGTTTSMSNPAPTVGMCIQGRPDLPGPLCHVVIGFDGVCHVVAAGRANHAGTAKATGPMPSGDGNDMYVGFEVDYSGSQDMGEPQYEAMLLASAAVLKHFGKDESFARGHKETSSAGKWDPGRKGSSSPEYLMGDIRADIRKRLKPKEDPFMALTDKEQERLLNNSVQSAGFARGVAGFYDAYKEAGYDLAAVVRPENVDDEWEVAGFKLARSAQTASANTAPPGQRVAENLGG